MIFMSNKMVCPVIAMLHNLFNHRKSPAFVVPLVHGFIQNEHVNIRCYPLGATACHETTKEVKG